MNSPRDAQAGIKRAWRLSCTRERISARSLQRLPLLFAIDRDLKIPQGFAYALDCLSDKSTNFCAGHIGCSSSGGCGGD